VEAAHAMNVTGPVGGTIPAATPSSRNI
jgi:hypothetical protein